jgi:hypothetical protein
VQEDRVGSGWAASFPLAAAAGAEALIISDALFETRSEPVPLSRIDELVFARWKQFGIQPANLCSDSVFLRRARLGRTEAESAVTTRTIRSVQDPHAFEELGKVLPWYNNIDNFGITSPCLGDC